MMGHYIAGRVFLQMLHERPQYIKLRSYPRITQEEEEVFFLPIHLVFYYFHIAAFKKVFIIGI